MARGYDYSAVPQPFHSLSQNLHLFDQLSSASGDIIDPQTDKRKTNTSGSDPAALAQAIVKAVAKAGISEKSIEKEIVSSALELKDISTSAFSAQDSLRAVQPWIRSLTNVSKSFAKLAYDYYDGAKPVSKPAPSSTPSSSIAEMEEKHAYQLETLKKTYEVIIKTVNEKVKSLEAKYEALEATSSNIIDELQEYPKVFNHVQMSNVILSDERNELEIRYANFFNTVLARNSWTANEFHSSLHPNTPLRTMNYTESVTPVHTRDIKLAITASMPYQRTPITPDPAHEPPRENPKPVITNSLQKDAKAPSKAASQSTQTSKATPKPATSAPKQTPASKPAPKVVPAATPKATPAPKTQAPAQTASAKAPPAKPASPAPTPAAAKPSIPASSSKTPAAQPHAADDTKDTKGNRSSGLLSLGSGLFSRNNKKKTTAVDPSNPLGIKPSRRIEVIDDSSSSKSGASTPSGSCPGTPFQQTSSPPQKKQAKPRSPSPEEIGNEPLAEQIWDYVKNSPEFWKNNPEINGMRPAMVPYNAEFDQLSREHINAHSHSHSHSDSQDHSHSHSHSHGDGDDMCDYHRFLHDNGLMEEGDHSLEDPQQKKLFGPERPPTAGSSKSTAPAKPAAGAKTTPAAKGKAKTTEKAKQAEKKAATSQVLATKTDFPRPKNVARALNVSHAGGNMEAANKASFLPPSLSEAASNASLLLSSSNGSSSADSNGATLASSSAAAAAAAASMESGDAQLAHEVREVIAQHSEHMARPRKRLVERLVPELGDVSDERIRAAEAAGKEQFIGENAPATALGSDPKVSGVDEMFDPYYTHGWNWKAAGFQEQMLQGFAAPEDARFPAETFSKMLGFDPTGLTFPEILEEFESTKGTCDELNCPIHDSHKTVRGETTSTKNPLHASWNELVSQANSLGPIEARSAAPEPNTKRVPISVQRLNGQPVFGPEVPPEMLV